MPIHPRVISATVASALASFVVAVLVWAEKNPNLFGSWPHWLQGLLVLFIPPLITFIGGWLPRSPVMPATSREVLPPPV